MSKLKKVQAISICLMLALVLVNTDVSITEANTYTGYEAVYQNNLSIYTNQRSDDRMMEYLLMEPDNVHAYLINDEIREVCQVITANCNTDMEKLQAIHDWVCNNLYYENADQNGAGTGVGSIYVFYHRGTRCEGYADLTASMCREVGIPCKEMNGYGVGGLSESIENLTIEEINSLLETKPECSHAWNEAWIDGRWVLLDTTWDSNNYKFSNNKEVTYAPCSQKYFDMSLEEFSKSHLFSPYISYFEYKFDEWNQSGSTSTPTGSPIPSTEKVENLLTVSGSRLISNDSSHDSTQNGIYKYDGYIQTMLLDTIKKEYPYYKVTFRASEKLDAGTEVLNFQPFNLEWGGWDSNIITIGDAMYNEETGEYTAYIAIQDICSSLSLGTLQGINLGFCNKEPVVTLTGFYQSSSKEASAQPQETEESKPASQSAVTDDKNTTGDKNTTTDRNTTEKKEKKPSKPGKVKLISCKCKGKKNVKLKWKKVSGSDGYQVQYSKKRSFFGKDSVYAYGKTKTLYGLKSKKKYFVRVRAYKEGNSANDYKNVYGSWSKVKKVRVK